MRLLWLKTELLHPVDKGGKIRTYQMLRELKKEHHITYLCLDDGTAGDGAIQQANEYANEVFTIPHVTSQKFTRAFYLELFGNLRSSLPYALEKYVSPKLRELVESMARTGEYDLLICDFLAPAVNVPPNLSIPALLFQHNVEAIIWRRHYEVATNPVKRSYFKLQWERMRRFEERSCKQFDWVVAVSEEDAEVMRRDYALSKISHVPTGVDTEYFTPNEKRDVSNSHVVFTGSMDWLPNEDGIQWFTREVLPRVKAKVPDATFTVVGRNPSSSLLELSKVDKSITVTGRVDDVRPYMRDADAYVVPIRIGGGTRLKIYEAMAMGLPVVSTTIGAEGLDFQQDVDILLRDAPYAFADAVVTVLQDKELAKRIGREAIDRVQRNNSWQKVAIEFTEFCKRAVEGDRSAKGRAGNA
jgi:sugar transferase (PEP-CTERM/EpsH1 system associated)